MIDVHQAFEFGARLFEQHHAPGGSDDWRDSPWGWIRDLPRRQMAMLTSDLVGFLLSSQGITNVQKDSTGGRSTVQVGTLMVDCYAVTRDHGEEFLWPCAPPTAMCSHVLLVGIAPMEAFLWLLEAPDYRREGEPNWQIKYKETREGGDLEKTIERLREVARESLRRAIRSTKARTD